jgi:hypothetical protein
MEMDEQIKELINRWKEKRRLSSIKKANQTLLAVKGEYALGREVVE